MPVQMALDSAGGCDVCLGRSLTPQPGRGRSLTPRPPAVFDLAGGRLYGSPSEVAVGPHFRPDGVVASPVFGLMAPTRRHVALVGSARRPLAFAGFYPSEAAVEPSTQVAVGSADTDMLSRDFGHRINSSASLPAPFESHERQIF